MSEYEFSIESLGKADMALHNLKQDIKLYGQAAALKTKEIEINDAFRNVGFALDVDLLEGRAKYIKAMLLYLARDDIEGAISLLEQAVITQPEYKNELDALKAEYSTIGNYFHRVARNFSKKRYEKTPALWDGKRGHDLLYRYIDDNDQLMLKKISRPEVKYIYREAALKNITDQNFLQKILPHEKDPGLLEFIAKLIDDESFVLQVLKQLRGKDVIEMFEAMPMFEGMASLQTVSEEMLEEVENGQPVLLKDIPDALSILGYVSCRQWRYHWDKYALNGYRGFEIWLSKNDDGRARVFYHLKQNEFVYLDFMDHRGRGRESDLW